MKRLTNHSLQIKFKVLTIVVSVFSVSGTLLLPGLVVAQSFDAPTGPVVPVGDYSTHSKLNSVIQGIGHESGNIFGGTLPNIRDVRGFLDESCKILVEQLSSSGGLDQFINSTKQTPSFWQSIIGGGAAEASGAATQAQVIQRGLDCVNDYLAYLEGTEIETLIQGQEIQREQAKFSEIATAMVDQIYALNARASAGWKDVAKALMVKTLLSVNKNVTSELANKVVQKYKINDYLAYGNALATQVYAMKYIDQNYEGDVRTQMMMRSLIQSEKVPQQARVAAAFANQQAKEYVAARCNGISELDATNASSLNCLASYGNEQASPMFKYLNALDTSKQIKNEAQKTAQAEISQSDGFAPPRNCGGSVEQQKQIDTQLQTAADEVAAAQAVLDRLGTALASGQTTQAEYDKAEAALWAADDKLQALPESVNDPVIDICDAIDSPAKYISNQVSDWVGKLTDSASDLKPENLPFYASFLSDVASNFLTNLLTGGKSTSKVLKEAGISALGQAVGSSVGGTTTPGTGPGASGSSTGDVSITAVGANGQSVTSLVPGQTYTIRANFSAIKNQNPSRVEIAGIESETIRRVVFAEEFNSGVLSIQYTATSQPLNLSISFFKQYDQVSTLLINIYSKFFPVAGTISGVVTTNFNPRGEARQPLQIR